MTNVEFPIDVRPCPYCGGTPILKASLCPPDENGLRIDVACDGSAGPNKVAGCKNYEGYVIRFAAGSLVSDIGKIWDHRFLPWEGAK